VQHRDTHSSIYNSGTFISSHKWDGSIFPRI